MVRIVSPRTGGNEIAVGRDEHEYREYVAAVHIAKENGAIALVIRFRLEEEERHRVMNGEDIYLTVLTFGGPIQPLLLTVGEEATLESSTPVT